MAGPNFYLLFRHALEQRVRHAPSGSLQSAIREYIAFLLQTYELEPRTQSPFDPIPISTFLRLLSCCDPTVFHILTGLIQDDEIFGVNRFCFVPDRAPFLIEGPFDFLRHKPLLRALVASPSQRSLWAHRIAATYIAFLDHEVERKDESEFLRDLLDHRRCPLWFVPVREGTPGWILLGSFAHQLLEFAGLEATTFWQIVLLRLTQGYRLHLTSALVASMPAVIQVQFVQWCYANPTNLYEMWTFQRSSGAKVLRMLVSKYRRLDHNAQSILSEISNVAQWVLSPETGVNLLLFNDADLHHVASRLRYQRDTAWFFRRWWDDSPIRALQRVYALLW